MNIPKRIQLIGCEVLQEEAQPFLAAAGGYVEPIWLDMGMHDQPKKLAGVLQEYVDRTAASGRFDAVVLLYGLCSKAIVDVVAREIPLIVPRVHDCISLYLGSAERYQTEHDNEPGTYWFSRGFLDRRGDEAGDDVTGPQEYLPAKREMLYQNYLERYGEDNADYLIETLVDGWRRNYQRVVLLTDGGEGVEEDRARVKKMAQENDWRYEEKQVDFRLVRMLLSGDWSADEFLVVPPGETIIATHDARIVGCQDCRATKKCGC